jgi:hypothetical protein
MELPSGTTVCTSFDSDTESIDTDNIDVVPSQSVVVFTLVTCEHGGSFWYVLADSCAF